MAIASPSFPPTAPNISPPITASCAPDLLRCRSIINFPRETIDFILRDCGAKLVFCDPHAARANARPGLPARVLRQAMTRTALPPSSIPARSRPSSPRPDEPAMFLYTSGSTGTPKGVVLSHQSHIWVVETRLEGQDLSHHRFLIAAPLYHMNALALAQLVCAAHATIVLLPQFTARGLYRRDRTPSLHLAYRRAADDRDDAARTRTDRAHRSASVQFVRMGSAPVSQSLMAGAAPPLPAGQGHQCLWHDRSRAGGVRSASARPRAAGTSVGYPHPKVATAARRRRQPRKRPGRTGNEMPGADARLSQPARTAVADHRRRLLPHRRRVPPRRRRLPLFSSAAPTTCSCPAARTSIPAMSSACWSATPPSRRPASCRSMMTSRATSRSPSSSQRAGRRVEAEEIKRFALAHAPAYQHPRFVWFLDRLPLSTTNKIDRAALKRVAAAHLAEIGARATR